MGPDSTTEGKREATTAEPGHFSPRARAILAGMASPTGILGKLRRASIVVGMLVLAAPFVLAAIFIARRRPELWFLYRWRSAPHPMVTSTAIATAPPDMPLTRLAIAAEREAAKPLRYEPAYVLLTFPGGDVPPDTGVCTDLVVRSYRSLGWDLQRAVHEDMVAAFEAYPRIWGLAAPDASIDHRRVPNLMVFFRRLGADLPLTTGAADYQPGDLVVWDLGRGSTHIGIVSTQGGTAGRRLIAHHVGGRPSVDDALLRWPILAHFRYSPPAAKAP